MRILITNDDGVFAPGIRYLAEWAKTLGEVTVVAPKVEQSGMSHAIQFVHPIEIKKVEFMEGVTAYSMDSTPADCVRFGVLGLKEQFDLVLSGINRGVNVGVDLVYSGTVGAVFEAARLGIPAIAFSTFPDTQEAAAKHFGKVYDFIRENKLFEHTSIFNVNIPGDAKAIKVTCQGSQYFSDDFVKKDDTTYVQVGHKIDDIKPDDLDRDTVAIHTGYISVTPLLPTRTDMPTFKKFRDAEEIFEMSDSERIAFYSNRTLVKYRGAFEKLALEAKFQALSPGGAISYVEVPDMQNNIEAVLGVMEFIYENIMYAELNTKSDYCQCCGYDGEIEIREDEDHKLVWVCPNCGNTDQSKMNVARRTCGYIGTQYWNQGRTQEIKDRVLHL